MTIRLQPRLLLVHLLSILTLFLVLTNIAQARSLADIVKSRELRACIAGNNPAHATSMPADCRMDCTFSGPVFEEVQAFARSLGQNIQLKAIRIGWEEQFLDETGKLDRDTSHTPHLLDAGVCDLYPTHLTRNAWRLRKMNFVTLFPSRMLVISLAARKKPLKTSADLAGLQAVVEKESSFHSWLEEQNRTVSPPIKIMLMNSYEASMQAVKNGTADFTMMDPEVANWTFRRTPNSPYAAFPIGPTDEIGWAFRKTDKDLQAAAALFFEEQRNRQDAELNRIWIRHYGRTLADFIRSMAADN